MHTNQTLLSIGMPVFNGENYIHQALDSLLEQDFSEFELIISDNASTDNTELICRKYAKKHPQISYHRNSENIGAYENFSVVFKLCSGKYFMWAAHDDIWEPTFISTLINALEKYPEYILAFCHYDNIGQNNEQIKTWPCTWKKAFSHKSKEIQLINFIWARDANSQKANFIYGIMPKSVLDKIFPYITSKDGIINTIDLTILIYLLLEGDFYITNECQFHKRYEHLPKSSQYKTLSKVLRFAKNMHKYSREHARVIYSSNLTFIGKTVIGMTIYFREFTLIAEAIGKLIIYPIVSLPNRCRKLQGKLST